MQGGGGGNGDQASAWGGWWLQNITLKYWGISLHLVWAVFPGHLNSMRWNFSKGNELTLLTERFRNSIPINAIDMGRLLLILGLNSFPARVDFIIGVNYLEI